MPLKVSQGTVHAFWVVVSGLVTLPAVIFAISAGPGRLAVVVAAGLGIVAVLLLPRRFVLSLSVMLFSLVPVAYMNVPHLVGRFFTPSVIVLFVWAVRVLVSEERRTSWYWSLVSSLLVFVMVIVGMIGIDPERSLLWTASFVVCLLIPVSAAFRVDREELLSALSALAWVTVLLSLFAIVEFALGTNPVATFYYAAADLSSGTNWSTYRVRTMLGHPLMNALFFSTSAVFFLTRSITQSSWRSLLVGALAVAAALLTGSRGGVLSIVLGMTFGILVFVLLSKLSLAQKIAGVILLMAAALVVWFNPVFQERLVTGRASTQQRLDTITAVDRLISDQGIAGSGPGTGQTLLASSGSDLLLENSILQFVLGGGIIVTILSVVLVLIIFKRGIAGGNIPAVAALIAYAASVSTFNILDQNPGSLVLFSIFAIMCIANPRSLAKEIH